MDAHLLRYRQVKACLLDCLAQLPASSVEVEKQHSNLQLDADAERSSAKRATPLQRDSYVMSAFLEHDRTLQAVEKECFGNARAKVGKIFRRARLLDTSVPGGGLVAKRKRVEQSGRVKGCSGLLGGILPLVCIHGYSNSPCRCFGLMRHASQFLGSQIPGRFIKAMFARGRPRPAG